jgi:hypothetical protein
VARKLIVWVEEEYGYRYWKWEVKMKLEDFIEWWKNLESVDAFFFNPGKTLPRQVGGRIRQVDWDDFKLARLLYLHLHTDGDSFLFVNGSESQHQSGKIFHKGFDPNYFGRKGDERKEDTDGNEV